VSRGRYRNSLSHPEPIPLNQPQLYHFTSATPNWFAVRAPKGSQLRLIVQSLNVPDLEKNYNSMKPVALQTGRDARIGHIRLLQTPDHPSELKVPLAIQMRSVRLRRSGKAVSSKKRARLESHSQLVSGSAELARDATRVRLAILPKLNTFRHRIERGEF
jgi:hypothetical protein